MRKELMNLYHAGELHDLALYQPNPSEKYVICQFGGGYVFQSYNLENDLNYHLNKVDEFYNKNL